MPDSIPLLSIVFRLLAALVAGAAIGWEREAKDKPAGLKTHILVTLGAAGFSLIAVEFLRSLGESGERFEADPLRIIHGIATGVGFLGAGAIIQAGGEVRGLTTAASIWVSAAVGVAAGLGLYLVTLGLVVFALVTLTGMRALEHRLYRDEAGD